MERSRLFGGSLLLFIIAVALFPPVSEAACVEFDEIAEDHYDRNYSSIHDDTRRPLGFLRSTLYYNMGGDVGLEPPCFSVDKVQGKFVEVKFETVPSMKLCFRDQTGQSRCEENNFEECLEAKADEMRYTFYCDVSEGCSESDVNFWVRITIGPSPDQDREMMWCSERDSEYPESLRELPPLYTPAPTVPRVDDAAAGITASVTVIISLLLISIQMIQ